MRHVGHRPGEDVDPSAPLDGGLIGDLLWPLSSGGRLHFDRDELPTDAGVKVRHAGHAVTDGSQLIEADRRLEDQDIGAAGEVSEDCTLRVMFQSGMTPLRCLYT